MKDLENVRFIVKEHTVALAAEVKPDKITGKHAGLKYINFHWTHEDFARFVQGYSSEDGYDHLMTSGDLCTIFHLDLCKMRRNAGRIDVPYVVVEIPQFVRKVLNKWAERVRATGEHKERWVELEITPERAARWLRLYGLGKGRCKIVMDDVTRSFLRECSQQDVESQSTDSLRSQLRGLVNIGRNRTSRFWQTKVVRVSKDLDGFFFIYPDPKVRVPLHGGIVNHAPREPKPNWSTHT